MFSLRRWLGGTLRARFLLPLLVLVAAGDFWLSVRPKAGYWTIARTPADEVASKLAESLPGPPGGPSVDHGAAL